MQNISSPETQQNAVFEVPAAQVLANLRSALKSTGSTFRWIAGLSLLNTILVVTKTNIMMLGGLGLTLIVDILFSQTGPQVQPIGFGINITIAMLFLALGMWAGKGHKMAFYIGMGLYGLDTCLYVFLQDWVNVAFHGYFLYLLFRGMQAAGVLQTAIAEVNHKITDAQA